MAGPVETAGGMPTDDREATTSAESPSIDLRVLVERYLDGVALIVNGRIRFANRKLCDMTGYTREESANMDPEQFLAPGDRNRALHRSAELGKGGEVFPSVYRVLHKSGTETPVEVLSRSIQFEGRPALLSVIRDVTEREEAAEKLRAGEERYRALYEANPTMYFTVDRNGVVQSVNRFGAEQLGYEPQELEGVSVLKVFLQEDHPTVRAQLEKCLQHEDGILDWELRKIRKDGSILWVHERSRTMRDADGNPLVLIVCEDITEQRRVAEALKLREAQLRVLSEITSDCCWVRCEHPDGRSEREWITGSMDRLTGYTAEEFERLGRKGLLHPEDYPEASKLVMQPEGDSQHEFRIVRKDGSVRWLREHMRVEKRRDGVTWVYGATRDVTEEKDAEEALRASREQLNQSQRLESLGKLAGGVAHDFNNLLMVIMGYGDLLLTETAPHSSQRRHAVALSQAAERAATLTGQLLAFSRKQTVQPRVVKLDTLITGMGGMLGRLVPENIELRLDLDPLTASIRIDPRQLEQVIMNLVLNACDAIESSGKIVISTRRATMDDEFVRLYPTAKVGEYVLLEVQDTGCGMNDETLKHVFEPFFTTKGPSEGTGLGLSAAYGIVKQSGGHVWATSAPGAGTAIKIYLPLTEEVAAPPVTPPRAEAHTGTETLLLVEDESMVREMVRDGLVNLGYTVLEAAGPRQAVDVARDFEGSIDLLITDVVMPEMDGKRLADLIVAERGIANVLFMSGYSANSLGKQGVLDPDVAFLQKPVSLSDLGRRVRELLDESQT